MMANLSLHSGALGSLDDRVTSQRDFLSSMTSSFDGGAAVGNGASDIRLEPTEAATRLSAAVAVISGLRSRADAAWLRITNTAADFRRNRSSTGDAIDVLSRRVAVAVATADESRRLRGSLNLTSFVQTLTYLTAAIDDIDANVTWRRQSSPEYDVGRIRQLVDELSAEAVTAETVARTRAASADDVGRELAGTELDASNVLAALQAAESAVVNYTVS